MYCPHTVTLVIASGSDLGTVYNSVILRGVFLDLSKGSNIAKSGMADADSATLFIPFSVDADKQYVSPKAYEAAENKNGLWTIFDGGNESGADCFFIKGEVYDATSYADARERYDYVYQVSTVDMLDYGSESMQHWEVGGK